MFDTGHVWLAICNWPCVTGHVTQVPGEAQAPPLYQPYMLVNPVMMAAYQAAYLAAYQAAYTASNNLHTAMQGQQGSSPYPMMLLYPAYQVCGGGRTRPLAAPFR